MYVIYNVNEIEKILNYKRKQNEDLWWSTERSCRDWESDLWSSAKYGNECNGFVTITPAWGADTPESVCLLCDAASRLTCAVILITSHCHTCWHITTITECLLLRSSELNVSTRLGFILYERDLFVILLQQWVTLAVAHDVFFKHPLIADSGWPIHLT